MTKALANTGSNGNPHWYLIHLFVVFLIKHKYEFFGCQIKWGSKFNSCKILVFIIIVIIITYYVNSFSKDVCG